VQRRTVSLLFGTQIIGGSGVAIGITVGALLAARLGGTAISGFASTSALVGGALLAVPVTRLMQARGRRPGLVLAYLAGAAGAALVVVGAVERSALLLMVGMFFFGGGTTANLQARYTAVDLAEPSRRGRQLSLVVWATTIGSVAAPNLTGLADAVVVPRGLPELSGPFVFSTVAFLLAAVVLVLFLRPDPLLLARSVAPPPTEAAPATRPGMRAALRVVAARPGARLGIAAVAVGHLVMVAVMAMTPVHIGEVHTAPDTLRIVGIVLSLHIAGMYALAPVVGVLTDKVGRRPVVLGGITLLLAACAVAGTAGYDTVRLAIGLTLIGLGWSSTMVAGSTLLTDSVPVDSRPGAQGLSDLVMGLAGAIGGALSGIVVETAGYPTLTLIAAIATVPLIALALRPVPAPAATV
jgi:MFS family permease